MRKKILLLLFSILSFGTNSFAQYHKDILGENFVQQTIQMPDDYEGKVIITIVRKEAALPTTKAILYVHGFNDYFFRNLWRNISMTQALIFMPLIYENTDAQCYPINIHSKFTT